MIRVERRCLALTVRIGCALLMTVLSGACSDEEKPAPTATIEPSPVTISIQPNEEVLELPARPETPRFAEGSTVQFTAIGGFDDLSTRDVTNEVAWASTNPSSVAIDDNGLATAVAPGSVSITATLGGAWDSASVTVLGESE